MFTIKYAIMLCLLVVVVKYCKLVFSAMTFAN